MNIILAIGISIGIIAGLWNGISTSLGILTYTGFFAWGTYYAVGGGKKAMKENPIVNVIGVFWGVIILIIAKVLTPVLGSSIALCVGVAIGAAGMCWQSKIPLLTFIPGTFAGCATFFATGANAQKTIIGLLCGTILGICSEWGTDVLVKITTKKEINK